MRYFLWILLLATLAGNQAWAATARVAIIIDDIGWRQTDFAALTLPGQVSYSVLPHTPYGKTIAHEVYLQQRDVLLHIPMEASNGKFMGPGGINLDMDEASVRKSLSHSIEDIPYAIGVNNHMGSRLTEHFQNMMWTMKFLKERDMFFLDSMTSNKSRAHSAANAIGLPNLKRHIFLDNQLDKEYIRTQFLEIVRYAKYRKNIIAIAHPHPETIEALTELIPTLQKHDIELVGISELLPVASSRLVRQPHSEKESKSD